MIALAALLVAILSSVGITRCAMQPKIKQAQKEAREAEREAALLQNDVTRLEEKVTQLETAQANAGVDSPWTSTGKFTTGDEKLDGEVKAFCDEHGGTGLAREEAALEMYKVLAWADYVERENAQHPSGPDWRITYAHQYYENDCSGNCYEFAAFLMYCLRYFGYDDALAQAVEIEFEGGNWGDHGIVFVTDSEGNECLCDTARGTDGWMVGTGIYNYRIMDVENDGNTEGATDSEG